MSEPSDEAQQPPPQRLRTYLGTAPGVGKTYAMLNDGRRRAAAGERVVVGWIERHGRPETRAQLGDLEVVPPLAVEYGGGTFQDLDVDAIIAREPDLVLVDELAHTRADGARRRWEDVAELLAAGISVITTVNVANLLSVRDAAAQVTGSGTVESVPDAFVRSGEVILVDLAPEALRRRIAAGRVYATGVGGALANYFRTSNLVALRQLAQAWMDGSVESVAPAVLARQGVGSLAPRPVVLAGVSGSEWGEHVISRAALLAADDDADLVVVHVNATEGLGRRPAAALERYRDMTVEAGGRYAELDGTSVVDSLAAAARDQHASRVVIARHRSWLGELLRGSVASRLRRRLPSIEVDDVGPKVTGRT